MYPYAPLASHVVGYMGAITADTIKDYRAKGYNAERARRPVRRRAEHGVGAARLVGQEGLRDRRRRQHRRRGRRPRGRPGRRPGRPADASTSTSSSTPSRRCRPSCATSQNLPPARRCAPHNPLDPTTNFKTRVFASSKEFGRPSSDPVQGARRGGGRRGLQHRPDRGDGQLPDVRQPLAGVGDQRRRSTSQLFPETDDPDKSILVNRAIQGQYNMGSSIKPFVAVAAIDAGIITPTSDYNDQGIYTLESIDPKICQNNGGTVRCHVQERDRNKHRSAGQVRPAVGAVGAGGQLATRSSTASARSSIEADTTPDKTYMKSFLQPFGFGTETGIQLPFEYSGRMPDDADQEEADRHRQVRQERGAVSSSSATTCRWRSARDSCRPRRCRRSTPTRRSPTAAPYMRPSIVKAIYAPLTPNSQTPEVADLSQGTIVQSFDTPTIANQVQLDQDAHDQVVAGLKRVIYGRGVTYPSTFYHATTGEDLFQGYSGMPIAGKTGTAQGAGGYPWNDSSAFGAFSTDTERPYAVYAYLEKSGYGAKAAGPVVKCIFLALSGSDAHGRGADQRHRSTSRPTRSPRRSTSPTRRASAPGRARTERWPSGCLQRKPDSGLGNIRASPASPSRNIDWVLLTRAVRPGRHRPVRHLLGVVHASSPTRTCSSPARRSS